MYKIATKHPTNNHWYIALWQEMPNSSDDMAVIFSNGDRFVALATENIHTMAVTYNQETSTETHKTILEWAKEDGIFLVGMQGFADIASHEDFEHIVVPRDVWELGKKDCSVAKRAIQADEKEIEEVEHPDGSRDVTVTVNKLDIKDRTEADDKAEDAIKKIFDDTKVGVLVIQRYTNDTIYFTSSLSRVRMNAEKVVDAYIAQHPDMFVDVAEPHKHFIVVESAVVTQVPKVTTLQ